MAEQDLVIETGKDRRTVHLAYDVGYGGADSLPDYQLTSNDGHPVTVLYFSDKVDGERHYFVLNEEYRRFLRENLAGGVVLPTDDVVADFGRNGRH